VARIAVVDCLCVGLGFRRSSRQNPRQLCVCVCVFLLESPNVFASGISVSDAMQSASLHCWCSKSRGTDLGVDFYWNDLMF
jgi:hypothetical protein